DLHGGSREGVGGICSVSIRAGDPRCRGSLLFRREERGGDASFEVEQKLLSPQAAAVAAELAAFVDDAVAGDDDGDAVGAVGSADRTLSRGGADRAGDVFVRPRFAVGDSQEFVPQALLERCARINERYAEPLELAGEVVFQLVLKLVEIPVAAGHDGATEAA